MTSPYSISHSPGQHGPESINAQYFHQYGQTMSGPYVSSTFATGFLLSTVSQESTYPYPTANSNGSYTWPAQPPTRFMSTGEPDEMSQGFSQAFPRAHTFTSFERGMTGDVRQLLPTSVDLVNMSMESQQSIIPPNLCEPISFQPIHTDVRHDWP